MGVHPPNRTYTNRVRVGEWVGAGTPVPSWCALVPSVARRSAVACSGPGVLDYWSPGVRSTRSPAPRTPSLLLASGRGTLIGKPPPRNFPGTFQNITYPRRDLPRHPRELPGNFPKHHIPSHDCSGVLECWSTGVLEYWSTGVLECWSTGVLEYWSTGVLEYWSTGVPECWRLEYWLAWLERGRGGSN